ncbi:MAG: hypothetical protein QM741_18000 [Rudaea sp.]|uniref:hypothetical protein n=1 Tax=Rudaea sp. TaxID=2136325 RepID=UPI0039E54099
MSPSIASMMRRPLTVALVVALLDPGAAFAATAKEKELEARVAQLEAQVQALLNAQKQQQVQIDDTRSRVADTQTEVAATKTQVADTKAQIEKAPKSTFTTGPGLSVAFHGFINANAFGQSNTFSYGNGANGQYPVAGSRGELSGVDIRNTRFWLDIGGAKFGENWTGGGRIEMDFFGGFNGTGAYSLSQPTPRLRQAYFDVANAGSGTNVRVGQQWDLIMPVDMLPDSVTHVAFPLGYGTGLIGWRYPGAVLSQNLGASGDTKWGVDIGVFEGTWSNQGTAVNHLTDGNADFRPQLEARLRAQGSNWSAFVAAHYASIDLKGVAGTDATPIKTGLDSTGFEVGATFRPGPWNFKALLYTGTAMGPLFGAMSQFGDIDETGGYFQAGYKLNKNWSVNAFYSASLPDKQDIIAWYGHGSTGIDRDQQVALNLIYAEGPYKLGIEALRATLHMNTGAAASTTTGNQVSLSGQYTF